MLCILCIPMISSQAMLKLTHSFCRYTKLTCENINFSTTHVKKYSHLSCRRKTCVTLYAQYPTVDSFAYTCQQLRLFANIKKKPRLKKSQSSGSKAQATIQMNNQLLPSVAYASHGGDFQVEDENSMDWDGPSTSSNHPNNKRRDKVPSDFRKWEQVSKKADGKPFRFRVVSYNMLAQYLLECHPYLYTECDPRDLSWRVRSERLFNEIIDFDPDILCFQEVQSTHLKSFYVKFEQRGYYGIYKRKTGHREDGCAIYFKKDVFDMDVHLTVEYLQPGMPILNRDNVGLIMKLVPRECPSTPIVVATTHLLYNPRRTDIRLAQLQVLLAELDRIAYHGQAGGKDNGYHPIVLTGDFNSTPESVVIKLLDTGRVSAVGYRDGSDWRRIGVTDTCQHLSVVINRPRGVTPDFKMLKLHNSDIMKRTEQVSDGVGVEEEEQEMVVHRQLFNSPVLRHPLRLASAYPRIKQDYHEEATTYQNYWLTVDYIYFSYCNQLRLLERLRLPTAQECEGLGRLPNSVFGSDHLMLAATFEVRPYNTMH